MMHDTSRNDSYQNKSTQLKPIIKWAGGKEKELKCILPNAPHDIHNFYEPFVGGGSVFTAIKANHYFINDLSSELFQLYQSIANQNPSFFKYIHAIEDSWSNLLSFSHDHPDLLNEYHQYSKNNTPKAALTDSIHAFISKNNKSLHQIIPNIIPCNRETFIEELKSNIPRKLARMHTLELMHGNMPAKDIYDNIETAFMGSLYFFYRNLYNDSTLKQTNSDLETALFVFIRNYAYSSMFRYNKAGKFNVPYGGISYNHKSITHKINYYQSEEIKNRFSKTNIYNLDFEDFLSNTPPQENDFVFLDPPYDSEFSTYAKNAFTPDDQKRLANYLIHHCHARWMIVIKNTPFILSLYNRHDLNIQTFNKKYIVSFMNRNNQNAEHLLITNYSLIDA